MANYRTEKRQTTQTSAAPCSPNGEPERKQGTCGRELGLSDPLPPHFCPSLPALGCPALPQISCCDPLLLAVSFSSLPNVNCHHTERHLAVLSVLLVSFPSFFTFLLPSPNLSLTMGSCKGTITILCSIKGSVRCKTWEVIPRSISL